MLIELKAEILAVHKLTDLMMIRNLQKPLGLFFMLVVVFIEQVKGNDPDLHM
jgi:hypothetical protein